SDAPPLLLKAARQFEPLDPRLARDTYLDALAAATFAGRLAFGGAIPAVAEAARAAPPTPEPPRPPDLLLDGPALLVSPGHAAGAPALPPATPAPPGPGPPLRRGGWAGSGGRGPPPASWGTPRAGTCCLPATSSSPVMLVRSPPSPSPSTRARGCTC